MRVLLVTSQVTYIPENYQKTFDELLKLCREDIFGLVLLKNLDFSTSKACLGLNLSGAKHTGRAMLKNIIRLPFKEREKLFKSHGLPVIYAKTMNDPQMISYIKENSIDLVINMRTRCIYKKAVLKAAKYGCLNIHHGLLPDYRGTLCDLYALADKRTAGFSIHVMTPKLDDGEILHVQEVSRGETNYVAYLNKTAQYEASAISDVIQLIKKEQALPKGLSNRSENITYSKSPDAKKIKSLLKKGMVL